MARQDIVIVIGLFFIIIGFSLVGAIEFGDSFGIDLPRDIDPNLSNYSYGSIVFGFFLVGISLYSLYRSG